MRHHFARTNALIFALAALVGNAPGEDSRVPMRVGGQRQRSRTRSAKMGLSHRAEFRRRRAALPTVMGRGSQAIHRARRAAAGNDAAAQSMATLWERFPQPAAA